MQINKNNVLKNSTMLENISILYLFKNAILKKKSRRKVQTVRPSPLQIVEDVVLRSCGSRIAAILDS